MRSSILLCLLAISGSPAWSQERQVASGPEQFVLGRHTFFDFGPPSDFYELFLVEPIATGASIERITLTPAADACLLPAKVETASASLGESPAQLLGMQNPCAIPEKELRRELKRCKHCLVFSGANISLQVQCGGETRIIRSDILDKDMFDPAANTPKHTSWTMHLLARLDQALGPGVMDKPMFPILDRDAAVKEDHASKALLEVSAGKYDGLFKGAPDRPSDLYGAAQVHAAAPTVRLRSSTPFQPSKFLLPEYPPLARAAHVEGAVIFKISVDPNGDVSEVTFDSGPPLLREAVKNAASGWKFAEEAFKQQVSATIDFALDCPSRPQ